MKILFITRHFGCLRNFEGALQELAARGHSLHLAAMQEEAQGGLQLVERLAAATPRITIGWTPSVAEQSRRDGLDRIRLGVDYLRYLEPAYEHAPRLRSRAEERAPRGVLWLMGLPGLAGARGRRWLAGLLRRLERAVPPDSGIADYLRGHGPDAVLFTPLIGLGTPEVEYLAVAKRLGLRTVFCVWSWDNLSSKSLLRDMPDAVTVWNETQRHEAVTLHSVPPERVVVTGAQCFDQWFGRQPSRSREELCRQLGLPVDRRFLLYVCSALFRGSPSEAAFVRRWAQAVRSSADPAVRTLPILVRPHPSRLGEWRDVGVEDLHDVVLWGGNPVTATARDDYFDSLYHSSVVVGLNTSAMLEAGIAGRPVMTVLLPEFAENQEGTLHFHYLLGDSDGLLYASRGLDAHIAQLSQVQREPAAAAARSERFVARFIRPFGNGVAGTDRFVAAVEAMISVVPQPAEVAITPGPLAFMTRWLVKHADSFPMAGLLRSPREHEELRRRNAYLRGKRREKFRRQAADRWARFKRGRERARRRSGRAAVEHEIQFHKRQEKAARQSEKRRRRILERRERLQAAILNRVRRAFGSSGE